MKIVLSVLGVLGWILLAYVLWHQHTRTENVRTLAEAAYEIGVRDGASPDISLKVMDANKEFCIDAVVKAHEGAWDKW